MNKKKQIHKCDYCDNKAIRKVYDEYTESYIYFCKDCFKKMNEDVNPSILKFLGDEI